MGLVFWLLGGAHAVEVDVTGGAGCVRPIDVEFELDEVSGLLGSDRVVIDLSRRTEPWRLYVQVIRREVSVWQRELSVRPSDCETLPAALALTIARGLEGVPRWPLSDDRARWQYGVETAFTVPYVDGSIGATLGRGPRPRGVWSWTFDASAFVRSPQPVDTGRTSMYGVDLGMGPAIEGRVGGTRIGIRPRGAVGAGVAVGSGFLGANRRQSVLRASAGLDVQVRSPQGFRGALRLTRVLRRQAFENDGNIAPEPRWRIGVVFGYVTSIRR